MFLKSKFCCKKCLSTTSNSNSNDDDNNDYFNCCFFNTKNNNNNKDNKKFNVDVDIENKINNNNKNKKVFFDNFFGFHETSLLDIIESEIKNFELVYCSFENDTIKKPFAIFYDFDIQKIVVSIRGF
jgi:hypothetical protein